MTAMNVRLNCLFLSAFTERMAGDPDANLEDLIREARRVAKEKPNRIEQTVPTNEDEDEHIHD